MPRAHLATRSALIVLFAALPTLGRSLPNVPEKASAVSAVQRQDRGTRLIAEADQIAQQLRANPHRPEAAELRAREARLRVLGALLDDRHPSSHGHAVALANAVLKDARQPAAARSELARLLAMLERKGTHFADRAAWLEARERAARQLGADFPELPAAFDELLAVADVSDRARALRIAREIAASTAPASIKSRAQDILWRQSAIGGAVSELLANVPGGAAMLTQVDGKLTLFYTWSPDDERSVDLALALAQGAPPAAVLIGINTSPRVGEALQRAQEDGLPGEQLYGARGYDSPIVRRLGLTRPSLLLAVGRDGVVRDLSAEADRAAALANLN